MTLHAVPSAVPCLNARRALRLKSDLLAARREGDGQRAMATADELVALAIFVETRRRASRQEPAPGGVVADVRASAPNFFGDAA